MPRLLLAVLLAVTLASTRGQDPAVISGISFRPPYNSFDADGNRQVPNFTPGGATNINENFIRLTQDRAGKRGWLWAKSPLDLDEWSATLRFRVSGVGQRLFGDGFALWFTQERYYNGGDTHGFLNKFVGFGIIFDTFRNTESNRMHRDVSIVISDGEREALSDKNVIGCDADFRFWEGRDDFSVSNKSVVKVTFKNNRVSVAIDAKNSGEFSSCLQEVDIGLPAGWHKTGYFGLTATTGQLADNHDILSFFVSSHPDRVIAEDAAESPAVLSTGNPQVDTMIAAVVNIQSQPLVEKLNHLSHHLEHQLSAIQDTIRSNIKKLQEAEDSANERLDKLTKEFEEQFQETLDDRVDWALDRTMESRIMLIEQKMKEKLDSKITTELHPKIDASVATRVDSAGRSWLFPFLFLLALLGAGTGFAYTKYKSLLKTNLL